MAIMKFVLSRQAGRQGHYPPKTATIPKFTNPVMHTKLVSKKFSATHSPITAGSFENRALSR